MHLLRLASGVASAAAFVSGGLLAARLGVVAAARAAPGAPQIVAFFALLGAGVMASPWLWAGLLRRSHGGQALALLNGLLALATLLPVLGAHPLVVCASRLLFGGVSLSLVRRRGRRPDTMVARNDAGDHGV